jgi:hypothetical protein
MTRHPFEAALGAAAEAAAPAVKAHFLQASGTRRYQGVMRRVWRRGGWQGRAAGPFLWLGNWTDLLFANTGTDVPFELEHTIVDLPDGRSTMTWARTFHFREGLRHFHGVMTYEPERSAIVDWLGKRGHVEVELHPRIEQGAITILSGRQWLKLGRFRAPIPALLAGGACIREWEEPDGSLGVCVTISNPILGEFFGYEGVFREVV